MCAWPSASIPAVPKRLPERSSAQRVQMFGLGQRDEASVGERVLAAVGVGREIFLGVAQAHVQA